MELHWSQGYGCGEFGIDPAERLRRMVAKQREVAPGAPSDVDLEYYQAKLDATPSLKDQALSYYRKYKDIALDPQKRPELINKATECLAALRRTKADLDAMRALLPDDRSQWNAFHVKLYQRMVPLAEDYAKMATMVYGTAGPPTEGAGTDGYGGPTLGMEPLSTGTIVVIGAVALTVVALCVAAAIAATAISRAYKARQMREWARTAEQCIASGGAPESCMEAVKGAIEQMSDLPKGPNWAAIILGSVAILVVGGGAFMLINKKL